MTRNSPIDVRFSFPEDMVLKMLISQPIPYGKKIKSSQEIDFLNYNYSIK